MNSHVLAPDSTISRQSRATWEVGRSRTSCKGYQATGPNKRTVVIVIEFDRRIAVVAVEEKKVQTAVHVISSGLRAVRSASGGA